MDKVQVERAPTPTPRQPATAPRRPSHREHTPVARRVVGAATDPSEREADDVARFVVARLTAAASSASDRGSTRIGRSADRTASVAATAPDAAPRIRRSAEPVVRRRIGTGHSRDEVRKVDTDARFVAHEQPPDSYSLQPIAGGPAIVVKDDDDAYDVVGPLTAEELAAKVQPATNPVAGYEMLEWTAQLRTKVLADDLLGAQALIDRMRQLAGGLPTTGVPLDDGQLDARLKQLPFGGPYLTTYRATLLLPRAEAAAAFKSNFAKSTVPLTKAGHDLATESAAALAERLATALQGERRKPEMVPTIVRLLTAQGVDVARRLAAKERVEFEAAKPTVMTIDGMAKLYEELAKEKFAHDEHPHKYDDIIRATGLDWLDGWTRAALIDHLEGTMVNVNPPKVKPGEAEAQQKETERLAAERKAAIAKITARTVEQIIAGSLVKKSSRMKYLFDERPDVFQNVAALVKDEKVHASLLEIVGGEQHSIGDINDYVGDKLNDPLMNWIVRKGIKVEVHATSALASFARMKAEGFTDVIEVPSSHEGTKKYIVARPDTGEARVVFQTLPGASYAIQTVGAFLFYELYGPGSPVGDGVVAKAEGPWRYGEYKARSMIEDDTGKHVATYLLAAHGQPHLTAAVPYVTKRPAIDADGAIVLTEVPASAIALTTAKATTLDPANLTVHKEDVDFTTMYLDILRSNHITHASIAAIGRKRELRKMFDAMKVGEPVVDLTLPNFNATMYALKGSSGPVNVVCFQISPDFFGDRSGFLAAALEQIGVRHITFVGTAGALDARIKKFDVMVPAELANFADRLPGPDVKVEAEQRSPNAALPLLAELERTADLATTPKQSGGLHLNVHSPITESQKMITWMKANDVQSVDCEAGFIADALKGSKVSLYAIYFISDVPGTEDSIGMGGITGGSATPSASSAVPVAPTGPAPTERMVREIIKKIVGREIERADDVVPPDVVKVTRDGRILVQIPGKKAGTFVDAEMSVSVALPGVGVGSDAIGVLKTFAQVLAKLPKGAEGRPRLDEVAQNALNDEVRTFYNTHKVKVIWSVK